MLKRLWTWICDHEAKERQKALNSCWYCIHRDPSAGFEMFSCKKKMVWIDGRGLIGSLVGLHPWKEYTFDALRVKGHKCAKFQKAQAARH